MKKFVKIKEEREDIDIKKNKKFFWKWLIPLSPLEKKNE